MSVDLIIRPANVPAATPLLTAVGRAPNDAVKTQLPPAQTVSAAPAAAFARNNPRTAPEGVARQIVVDRAAASFVYQVVDERTNQVITQFPDDAILRRRAYFRSLDLQKSQPQVTPTDRSA